jgi:signal transduction histidine kinase
VLTRTRPHFITGLKNLHWTTARVSPYPLKQGGLYTAYGVVILLLLLGVFACTWLWQVKDWGIVLDESGRVMMVQAGSHAAQQGILPGDQVGYEDFQQLRRLSGTAFNGQQVTIPIQRGERSQMVTLDATPTSLGHLIELSVITWVGIGFVLLGIAPLIARRRTSALWTFFLATEVCGLFLITEGPRPFHLPWAEFIAYLTMPLFPAVLFQFHTLFPQRQLGRWRVPLVVLVYAAALVLMGLDVYALKHVDFDNSLGWAATLRLYLVSCLLACLVLLIANYRSQVPRIRTQLKIIVLCAGAGLAVNGLILFGATLLNVAYRRPLENLSVLAALLTPFGYAYAMLRYNVLIDGLVWRRWLVRGAVASGLLLSGVAGILLLLWSNPFTEESLVFVGALAIPGALVLGAVHVLVSERIEARLFRGSSYVDLLDYATHELTRFQRLDEYVHFFINVLPTRLKTVGALVLLSQGDADDLLLCASSPGLSLPDKARDTRFLSAASELRRLLEEMRGVVSVSTFLVPQAPSFPTDDSRFLTLLQAARMELLLPLVSSKQGRLVGLVALGGKETDEPYSDQERAALSALMRTAATAAENVLLVEQLAQQLDQLREERAYRVELARYANAAQEMARRKVARDLHDSSLQELGILTRALSQVREDVQDLLVGCEELTLAVEAYQPTTSVHSADVFPKLPLLKHLTEWQARLGLFLGEDTRLTWPSAPSATEGPGPACSLTSQIFSLESRPTVEGLIAQVSDTAQHMREICNDLHPTYLNDPLGRTLMDSVARLNAQHPAVQIGVTAAGTEPADLPDEVKISCKQIMEQAIYNALTHAQATHITVALTFQPNGDISLFVEDNGKGFTPRSLRELRASKHHGLANMQERADLVDGDLRIDSAPGIGTHIRLHIPPHRPSAVQVPAPPSKHGEIHDVRVESVDLSPPPATSMIK